MLVMGAVSLYNIKAAQPLTGLVVIGNAVIITVLARMFSPFLIAPGIAAALAMAMVFTPRFSWLGHGFTIAVSMILSILGPLALEYLGVLDPTMGFEGSKVVFHAPVIGEHSSIPVLIAGTLYVAALIAGACLIAEIMRARNRAAHRHLLMQAWQLRQLVPASK